MKYVAIILAVILLAVGTFAATKKVSPVGWGWWGITNTSAGLALQGYDPVAYFEAGAAKVGDPAHSHDWADATWHFSSAENQALFAANPQQYAPQFGSFCAFAVSKGVTADTDPEAWYIVDDRLYVFADQGVRDQWIADIEGGSRAASEEGWGER